MWPRASPGLVGAVVTSATGDVQLNLVNLHGDVAGTIDIGLSTPALLDFDEFGVAQQPAVRFGWLGAKQRSAEALGDVILMGVRLYSPALGRFLQRDPVAGGSCSAYDYACGDPVNHHDLDGKFLKKFLKATGNFLVQHAGTISVVAGALALIPTPFSPFLGAVSFGFGVLDAAMSCKSGKAVSCALGVASIVPGVKAIAGAGRTANRARKGFEAATKAKNSFVKGGKTAGRPGTR
ncbi:hypothetical protein GCM10010399_66040 [Dactylosporangium fulvum]|uniref:RHS repeat-associated core domain-containing protein n=1 Tax=Dactylosporangium fulvum TaxID=53359 RepID=A0ABY5VRV1_9ACTN|nr:RHS repeat-associated core domain-containing protein [Dactylosporangium fulvum]UWP80493.1 hypothetical protein Dfulv_35780 [Dactylosporangium fulvum]